jgi:DNA polymerase-4
VGPATRERLASRGIHTIGELASTSPASLQNLLGNAVGAKLGSLAANADPRRIETARRAHSVGAQSALGRRPAARSVLRAELGFLADRVATRLRAKGRAGRTITVRVRFVSMRSVTRSVTLPGAVSVTLTLAELGVDLAEAALADHPEEREITLLAISVSNLVPESALQLELDLDARVDQRHRPGTPAGAARWASDRAMDRVRDRFGRAAVGYGDVMFREGPGVPDEFRELAEKDAAALPESRTGNRHHDERR